LERQKVDCVSTDAQRTEAIQLHLLTMSDSGHPRLGRAGSRSSQVRSAQKAEAPTEPSDKLKLATSARAGQQCLARIRVGGPMLCMIIDAVQGSRSLPVYKRVRDAGVKFPDGLKYLGSWIAPNFDRCFRLMECDDARLLQERILADNRDFGTSFEIVPVVPIQQTARWWRRIWIRLSRERQGPCRRNAPANAWKHLS
jgi:hypothetical protein